MRRHPEISLRSPRQLGKERLVIRPEHVAKWFHDFEAFIKDTTDPTILQDPSRIYNADESGFCMSSKTGHVLGLKGTKVCIQYNGIRQLADNCFAWNECWDEVIQGGSTVSCL